jgi:hypothetical protein
VRFCSRPSSSAQSFFFFVFIAKEMAWWVNLGLDP